MNDPNREAFERWVKETDRRGLLLNRVAPNPYWLDTTQLAWEAWCAGQEHLPGPQPDEPMKFYFKDLITKDKE